ncbi:hypothetical protein NW766_007323 [Fusarium irregulare]|uniref:Uncharacterized protein n=1 Tax=Fusarium irregulare TaxID=2494466 RepID=A0A9W8U9V4_9HYPO|nr:hypothetical protein NW766_007323 [Fusarium irregulare]
MAEPMTGIENCEEHLSTVESDIAKIQDDVATIKKQLDNLTTSVLALTSTVGIIANHLDNFKQATAANFIALNNKVDQNQ